MKFRFFLNCSIIACIFLGCDFLNKNSSDIEFDGQFVYTSEDKNGNAQIYISLTDGVPIKRLTNFTSDDARNPSWSPDGKQIAFERNYVDPNAPYFKSKENTLTYNSNTLYIIDSNGSNMRPLHRNSETGELLQGYSPTWSSDGKKIAFVDFEIPYFYHNTDIYVYDFDKESVSKITNSEADENISAWSSDNQSLYFTSDRNYLGVDSLKWHRDLFKIDIESLEVTNIMSLGKFGTVRLNKVLNKLIIENSEGFNFRLYDLETKQEEEIEVIFPNYLRFRIIDAYSPNQYYIFTSVTRGVSNGKRLEVYNSEDQSVITLFPTDEISGLDWINK